MDDKLSGALLNLLVTASISGGYGLAKQYAVAKLDAQGNPVIDWTGADAAVKAELMAQLRQDSKLEDVQMAIVSGSSN